MATYYDTLAKDKSILDLFSPGQLQTSELSQPALSEQEGFSSTDKRAAISAGMSSPGGIGDKLMSGGISAGLMGAGPVGWGVAGGGLVLSLIEAEQKRKAEEEAAKVAAENQKTENMKAQIGKLMNMRLGV